MSSFIGHDLAAVGIYNVVESPLPKRIRSIWLIWLMILASIPDIDYIITPLRINGPEPIRVTHSIVGSAALPILTILVLVLLGYRGAALRICGLQAIAAGLSHIGLDLLVGGTPMAVFWPLSLYTFRLPFGILPTAAKIDLRNPLLYYNSLIEIRVLAPIPIIIYRLRKRYTTTGTQKLLIGGLTVISLCCMAWASTLSRY